LEKITKKKFSMYILKFCFLFCQEMSATILNWTSDSWSATSTWPYSIKKWRKKFFKKFTKFFYVIAKFCFQFLRLIPAAQTCEHLGFVILDPENSLLALKRIFS